jgi:hypothetical protein
LLPLPVDSNDPFHNMVTPYGKQRAPDGLMVRAFGDDTQKTPVVQFFALPRVAAYYDTGFHRIHVRRYQKWGDDATASFDQITRSRLGRLVPIVSGFG